MPKPQRDTQAGQQRPWSTHRRQRFSPRLKGMFRTMWSLWAADRPRSSSTKRLCFSAQRKKIPQCPVFVLLHTDQGPGQLLAQHKPLRPPRWLPSDAGDSPDHPLSQLSTSQESLLLSPPQPDILEAQGAQHFPAVISSLQSGEGGRAATHPCPTFQVP